jgi:hypothetical protein
LKELRGAPQLGIRFPPLYPHGLLDAVIAVVATVLRRYATRRQRTSAPATLVQYSDAMYASSATARVIQLLTNVCRLTASGTGK